MVGIKFTLDEVGEPQVYKKKSPLCIIEDCKYIKPDWICGYNGKSVWDQWYDPGWCPIFKWYRSSKRKEFNDNR